MKKYVYLLILVLVSLGISSCSTSDSSKTKDTADKESVESLQKDYVVDLSGEKGKVWKLTGQYKGEKQEYLSDIKWEASKKQYSFVMLTDNTALLGAYEEDFLDYGRVFSVDGQNDDGFFSFRQTKMIVSQRYFDTVLSEADKSQFHLTDIEIPEKKPEENYYESVTYKIAEKDTLYRFYLTDDGYFIRENYSTEKTSNLAQYKIEDKK